MGNSYKLFETRLADNTALATEGVAVSGTGVYYGNKMSINQRGDVGFELRFVGTAAGVLTFWFSDMDNPSVANDTDWIQDDSWTPTNPAGADLKVKYARDGIKGRWARIKYVNASGSGTLYGREGK